MKTLPPPYHRLLLGVCLLLGIAGCAIERGKVYVKDGKTYGVTPDLTWRDRWWDYYQRGLSYAAGAFWPEAIADLQAALRQRQADQRDVLTYGLHFLDYFPHRELGLIYYQLGRYVEARGELEASLRSVDTAKAKFYLNKVRREELKQSGRELPVPRVHIDAPVDGLWTNQLAITVTGRAEAEAFIAAVTVHGQELFVELAASPFPFAQEVALTDGPNVVEVSAMDLLGRLGQERLTVHVDRRGPLVSLESVAVLGDARGDARARRLRVTGAISDASPIRRFTLAGEVAPRPPESTGEFRQEVPLAADLAFVPFEVEDAAGNVTRGKIPLAAATSTPPGNRQSRWLIPDSLPWSAWASLSPDTVMADVSAAPSQAVPPSEQAAPVIRLEESLLQQPVYDDKIYLEGDVTSAHTLVAFAIAGEAQLPGKLSSRRASRRLFFGQMVSLQVGDNPLRLEATDAMGQTTQREVVVRRQVQEARQLEARWRITVLPLARLGEPSGLAETVDDYLLAAFVQQGRFRLLERARLEDILREQRFSQTAYVDRAFALKTGKIAAVEGILYGLMRQQPAQTLEVIVHFVDVETTAHLASVDVYGEDVALRDVKALMHGLTWKFQQHFPLVEGVVVERDGARLLVNRGSQQALKPLMKAVLFRDSGVVTDPDSGKPLGRRIENLGEARIVEVADAVARAELLRSAAAREVKKLDRFITK